MDTSMLDCMPTETLAPKDRTKASISDPVKIGSIELKNRMYAAPMVCLHANEDGNVTQRLIDIYRRKALGGWGLVCVEASSIRYDGRLFSRMLGIYKDPQISGLNELAEAIRDGGAKSCIQIMHGGRQANTRFNGGTPLFAPSSVAPWPPDGPLPREMTTGECKTLANDFATAAGRAQEAGFDCVQLHGAHGFLLQQFMSPYTNQRTDLYGDGLAFVTEVITKVRRVVGPDYPIGFRVSADEFLGDKGLTLEDFTHDFAPAIEEAGIDWLDISAGTFETLGHWVPPLYSHKARLVGLAEKVKEVVSIPVSGIGQINDPKLARKLIENDKIDIVAFGRQVLADPDFPKKLLRGQDDQINRCIACDMGCTERLLRSVGIKCAVNFEFSRDMSAQRYAKTDTPKHVMVIGGGIAGMEVARILAQRDHRVTLYEKGHELGGTINLASAIPAVLTTELKRVVQDRKRALQQLDVKVELNQEADAAFIENCNPDVVVLATGASPSWPDVPGLDSENVFTYEDYLKGKAIPGDNVVVLGGNHGAEIALSLAKAGKQVTIVEASEHTATTPYMYVGRTLVLQDFLQENNVEILTESTVKAIDNHGVLIADKEGKEFTLQADAIIIAQGREPNKHLTQVLKGSASEIYEIGDCVEPLNILSAISQAAIVARDI